MILKLFLIYTIIFFSGQYCGNSQDQAIWNQENEEVKFTSNNRFQFNKLQLRIDINRKSLIRNKLVLDEIGEIISQQQKTFNEIKREESLEFKLIMESCHELSHFFFEIEADLLNWIVDFYFPSHPEAFQLIDEKIVECIFSSAFTSSKNNIIKILNSDDLMNNKFGSYTFMSPIPYRKCKLD